MDTKVYDRLSENKIVFCSVNHPTLPDILIANTAIIYVRLQGSSKMFYSNYSHDYLKILHQNILKQTKIKEIYIYFNNTSSAAGVVNAMELSQLF